MKVGVAPVIDPDAPSTRRTSRASSIIGAIVVAYAQTATRRQQRPGAARHRDRVLRRSSGCSRRASRGAAAATRTRPRRRQLTKLLERQARRRWRGQAEDHGRRRARISRRPSRCRASATKALPPDYPAVTAGAIVLAPISETGEHRGHGQAVHPAARRRRARDRAARALPLASPARRPGRSGRARRHRDHQRQPRSHVPPRRPRARRPRRTASTSCSRACSVGPSPARRSSTTTATRSCRAASTSRKARTSPPSIPTSRRSRRSPSPTTTSASTPSTSRRARRPGNPDEVSFENFIAKLKVNEGKLKAQYQCRAVRFRVVTKDGKVSLKPVPIFASMTVQTGLARLAAEGSSLLAGRRRRPPRQPDRRRRRAAPRDRPAGGARRPEAHRAVRPRARRARRRAGHDRGRRRARRAHRAAGAQPLRRDRGDR